MTEKKSPSLASRVVVSILLVVGWLVFLVIFLAFHVPGFGTQNLAIILASLLVVVAILSAMWAQLGIMWREISRTERAQAKK